MQKSNKVGFIGLLLTAAILLTHAVTINAQGDPIHIMPVGESITKGLCDIASNCQVPPAPIPRDCIDPVNINPDATGFRGYLQNYLMTTPAIPFDFVGSLSNGATTGIDPHHDGHGAWFIPNLTDCIQGWVEAAKPDIILLHVGTNDLLQVWLTNPTDPTDPIHVQTAVSHLQTLLNNIYTVATPTTRVILAQIIRSGGQGATSYNQLIVNYNQEIETMISTMPCKHQLIPLVNMYPVVTDTHIAPLPQASPFPYQHPTPQGYDLMAQTWETAVRQLVTDGLLDTPCHFGTRTYDTTAQSVESITAQGRYWNFAAATGTLLNHGNLDDITRYRNEICIHHPTPTSPCDFETRTLWQEGTTPMETVTAYGRFWQFQLAPTIQLLDTAPLTDTYPTLCPLANKATCQLDTLVHFNTQSPTGTPFTTITAYGRYWNIPQTSPPRHPMPTGNIQIYLPLIHTPFHENAIFTNASGNLTDIPWYRPICAQNPLPTTHCTFDTRTFIYEDDYFIESITAYGRFWNVYINHPHHTNGTLQATGSLPAVDRY